MDEDHSLTGFVLATSCDAQDSFRNLIFSINFCSALCTAFCINKKYCFVLYLFSKYMLRDCYVMLFYLKFF